MNPTAKQLKRRFASALAALLIAFIAVGGATFAWYIYNTSVHTTRVRMAAGSSVALYISDTQDGLNTHQTATTLKTFTGELVPVSTDRIQTSGGVGFQHVTKFTNGTPVQAPLVASQFAAAAETDYYKTDLYFLTDGSDLDLYLSGIEFTDSKAESPISTAIRLGLVIPDTGEEFIFAINEKTNPQAQYNTATGQEGYVLDSSKTDGSTIPFKPYTADNFAEYNPATGITTLKPGSTALAVVKQTPLHMELYIWLEGCDQDCTLNLCATTLQNLALSFCGVNKNATAAQ